MRTALLYKTGTATVLSLLTALSATGVQAEGRQIEEVIVTAERQEASVQDTSISITALTGEFMEDFTTQRSEASDETSEHLAVIRASQPTLTRYIPKTC